MDPNKKELGKLPSERKVEIMMDMTSACVRICADGIRAQNPDITETELLEKLRERVQWRKHMERGEE